MKPFIPAWLDDSGLSPAEMRVFVHLCRSADNQTGIAWPSYRRMIEITGMGKSTIRRAIESLEDQHKLIAKMGKPFAGSCRYKVLPIVPPEGQKESSNSSTRAPIEAAPIVPPQTRNSPSDETSIVPPEGQEGNPKKVIQRRVSNKENSPEGIEFAKWFKSTLPETINLKSNWQEHFAKAHDDLVRLDHRSSEEIRRVSQWARTEDFWQSRFMSPAKLRDRNKEGIQYFDVFVEQMKQSSKPSSTITTGNRRGHEERLQSDHRAEKRSREYHQPRIQPRRL